MLKVCSRKATAEALSLTWEGLFDDGLVRLPKQWPCPSVWLVSLLIDGRAYARSLDTSAQPGSFAYVDQVSPNARGASFAVILSPCDGSCASILQLRSTGPG